MSLLIRRKDVTDIKETWRSIECGLCKRMMDGFKDPSIRLTVKDRGDIYLHEDECWPEVRKQWLPVFYDDPSLFVPTLPDDPRHDPNPSEAAPAAVEHAMRLRDSLQDRINAAIERLESEARAMRERNLLAEADTLEEIAAGLRGA